MTGQPEKIAIQTDRLSKSFPSGERLMGLLPPRRLAAPAVDRVSLKILKGELFGLLGPNGAGKTTLVKMLATLVAPTSGSAVVCGFDLSDEAAIKAAIGLVTTDERSFYWRLTGRQNLAFFGGLHGLPDLDDRIAGALALVGLESPADQAFKEYSTGMRQRLAIARALLHRPQVLFLDEPTRGLDPPAIRALQGLIRDDLTARQGLTVLMTTHWLHEAETLCDRVAILHHGRIRGMGTVSELRQMTGEASRYRLLVRGPARRAIDWPATVEPDGDGGCRLADDIDLLNRTVDAVRAAGGRIEGIRREEAPLEDIFDRLVRREEAPLERVVDRSIREKLTGSDHRDEKALAAQTAARPQPSPAPGFLRVTAAFFRRDWQSERSYRLAFILSFSGIIFSAAIFFYVARLIDAAAAPYLGEYGGSYFSFVLVGIALQRYFGVGLSGFSNAFRQAQTTGTLEAMLTTPARLWQIVLASSLWSYGLVSLQVVLYILVGVGFLGVELNVNGLSVLLAGSLSVVSFASLGILSAGFVMVLKRGDPISWVVGAVSTFFGGVYFPVELLPGWLQPVSALLPVTYSLRAIRLALLRGAGVREIGGDLLALAAFCALLLPLGLLAFRCAVRRAKVDGSLTHY